MLKLRPYGETEFFVRPLLLLLLLTELRSSPRLAPTALATRGCRKPRPALHLAT